MKIVQTLGLMAVTSRNCFGSSTKIKAIIFALAIGLAHVMSSPIMAATVHVQGGGTLGHFDKTSDGPSLADNYFESNADHTSTASASVDLASGTLKASAKVTTPTPGSNLSDAISSSLASFSETLLFSVGGVSDSELTPIVIRIGVDGLLSGRGGLQTQAALSFNIFGVGSNGNSTGQLLAGVRYRNPDGTIFDVLSGDFSESGPTDFQGTINLRGAQTTLFIAMDLSCSANIDSECSFGNSAHFRFAPLPNGVTFTSSSGVFLSSVPVPAAIWFLGSALMGVGVMRRRSV